MKSRIVPCRVTMRLSEFVERFPLLARDYPDLVDMWSAACAGRSDDDVVTLSASPIGVKKSKLIVDIITPAR